MYVLYSTTVYLQCTIYPHCPIYLVILVKTSVHNCSYIQIIIRCRVDGDEEEEEEEEKEREEKKEKKKKKEKN